MPPARPRASLALPVALGLLAGALAGCVGAPEPAPAADAPASVAPLPGRAPGALALGAADDAGCPPAPERTEEAEGPLLVVRVVGCVLANEPVPLPHVPRDVDQRFEVPEGALALLVQWHLHGDEPIEASLHRPGGAPLRADAQGDARRDSVVRFELADPEPGTWRLTGEVGDLALLRPWTVVAVVERAGALPDAS